MKVSQNGRVHLEEVEAFKGLETSVLDALVGIGTTVRLEAQPYLFMQGDTADSFYVMVEHVHVAHSRLRAMTVEPAEQRLARALLHYAERFGEPVDVGISITLPLSQRDLAEYVGTTLETINRILKMWKDGGVVALTRQHVDVLDKTALERLAGA